MNGWLQLEIKEKVKLSVEFLRECLHTTKYYNKLQKKKRNELKTIYLPVSCAKKKINFLSNR